MNRACVLFVLAGCLPATVVTAKEPSSDGLDLHTATPMSRPGVPTYDETVSWLEMHSEGAGFASATTRGTHFTINNRIFESRWPCVLFIARTVWSEAKGKSQTLLLLSLAAMNVASITTSTPEEPGVGGAVVTMRGREGMLLEVEGAADSAREKDRLSVATLIFSTRTDAERAAKALSNAGELCGATKTKEPF